MKKAMLIVGIVLIAACIISLLISAFNSYVYHNVLDGSQELYDKIHQRMIVFLGTGIALAVIGAGCIFLHFKL
ncbi:MAG: hypothetical protein IKX06_03355 [Clostridia bacterium]|nr:hypothetical protein [Clostridia bacterium]